MRKSIFILSILALAFALHAVAQRTCQFKNGLMISAVSRYGREAVYADPLLYKLYSGDLKRPVVGDSLQIGRNNQFVKWTEVTADSLNRFRSRGGGGFGGGGGYLYLTYQSDKNQSALLHVKGNSAVLVNGVLHTGDPYALGWLYIPVELRKGLNEFYVRGGSIVASLVFPEKPIAINTEDATLPFIAPGNKNEDLMGAVVIINTTSKTLKGLKIKSRVQGKEMSSDVPSIPPTSTRKIIFHFNGGALAYNGNYDCLITLVDNGKNLDEKKLSIPAVDWSNKYSSTFISDIDGSLQYYAVTPKAPDPSTAARRSPRACRPERVPPPRP